MPGYNVAFVMPKIRGSGDHRKPIIVTVDAEDAGAAEREVKRLRPDLAERAAYVDVSRSYGAYIGVQGNRLTKVHR